MPYIAVAPNARHMSLFGAITPARSQVDGPRTRAVCVAATPTEAPRQGELPTGSTLRPCQRPYAGWARMDASLRGRGISRRGRRLGGWPRRGVRAAAFAHALEQVEIPEEALVVGPSASRILLQG